MGRRNTTDDIWQAGLHDWHDDVHLTSSQPYNDIYSATHNTIRYDTMDYINNFFELQHYEK